MHRSYLDRLAFYAMKEFLSRSKFSTSKLSTNDEPIALPHHSDIDTITHEALPEAFSISCSLRTVRVEASVCLLSRINYCFPRDVRVSVPTAMRHAEQLNTLLSRSKVHVVKDIDGDRGYFLEIDSVLQGEANRSAVDAFLVGVTQDMETVLKYFQRETDSSQPARLSVVAKDCNVASLKTNVRMVA